VVSHYLRKKNGQFGQPTLGKTQNHVSFQKKGTANPARAKR
jgi:hypothetical protein